MKDAVHSKPCGLHFARTEISVTHSQLHKLTHPVNSMMFLSDEAFIIQYYIFISQVFAEQSQHDIVCEFAFAALGSLDQIHDEAIVKHNVVSWV